MHSTSILSTLLLTLPLAAQQHFIPGERSLIDINKQVLQMIPGDFDADGDIDLACLSRHKTFPIETSYVELYENTGMDSFVVSKAFRGLEISGYSNSLAWIDTEGDGDLDLLIAGGYQSNRLFVRDASGHYQDESQQRLPFSIYGTGRISVFDFDGDGAMDFVAGPAFFRNLGKGSFIEDSQGRTPAGHAVGKNWPVDLDGDGDQDLVLIVYNLNLRLVAAYNDGAGHFLQTAPVTTLPVGSQIHQLIHADLDQDGDQDLCIQWQSPSKTEIFINLGGRKFSQQVLGGAWHRLASSFSDVDGDKDLDLIAYGVGQGSRLLLNDGSANFSTAAQGALPPFAIESAAHLFIDIDGDGQDEVIARNGVHQSLWARKAPGNFVDSHQSHMPRDRRGSYGELVDLNGDQVLDLIKAHSSNLPREAIVMFGTPHGKFVEGQQLPAWFQRLRFADLDGDGDLDFYGYLDRSTKDSVYTNDGKGRFTLSTKLSAAMGPLRGLDISFGDVDGDGDPDAFATPFFGMGRLLLNQGQGQFLDVSATHLPTNNTQEAIHEFVDIDNDGDLDLYIGNNGADFLYRNDGTGHYQDDPFFLRKYKLHTLGVTFADVDGDGFLDIFLRHKDSTWMLVQTNSATSTIAENWRINDLEYEQIFGAQFADIDGDGFIDLVVSHRNGVQLHLNLGFGKFIHIPEVHYPNSLITADPALRDIDGDGDIDLILSNSYEPTVQLNLNRQVAVRTTALLGGQLEIDFFDRPGRLRLPTHLITFLDDHLTKPQTLFGRNWYLDLSHATLLPAVVLPAPSGHASLSVTVPRLPWLIGLPLHLQSVFLSSAGRDPAVSAVESFVIPW